LHLGIFDQPEKKRVFQQAFEAQPFRRKNWGRARKGHISSDLFKFRLTPAEKFAKVNNNET